MSHTPGPWKTNDLDNFIEDSQGFDICVVSERGTWRPGQSGMDYSEQCDNAALIAAAPELLEACEALLLYGLAIDALSLAGIADDVLNPIAKAVKKAKGTP